MNTIAAPRGTADLYPPQSARWQGFEAVARETAHRYGYGEIRTPMFESTDLFVRGVGETTDIVEKEMYTFEDKGGRSLTLRPEWTAPVVRAMLEHSLLQRGPQRLYYIGPFFRYERPQAGRYRQANQFGTECFGYAGPEADVEVMQIAAAMLRAHRVPGVTLLINTIGDACCRPAYREALLAHFRPHAETLSEDSRRRLERNPLRILDSKAPEDRPLVESAPSFHDSLCDACAAHFAGVRACLDAVGVAYVVDPKLVRGFDYYTRTVFEFVSTALGAQSTVCGGGRYDDLVRSLGGPPTPAVGFGMGIERFLMVLEKTGLAAEPAADGLVLIALGDAARAKAYALCASLRDGAGPHGGAGSPGGSAGAARRAEPRITMDYGGGKVAAQFKRAERAGIRAAVIIGEDEVAAGTVVVRDLGSHAQSTLAAAASPAGQAAAILDWYAALPALEAAA